MNAPDTAAPLTAEEHASGMAAYITAGERRALALGNRGPIRLDSSGGLHPDILAAYREHGFYVFQDAIGPEELADLRGDMERTLARAPVAPDSDQDRDGNPALGQDFARSPYRFARPLSDPLGGTSRNKGRHPVKVAEPTPADGAPEWTIELLHGNLQLMDSCLRLYGHPGLLAACEAVLGADFVPYNEVVFIKEPGLGPSVAWHQDGTTHWDAPDWDMDAHGFNFMAQLYPSTPGNGVWVLPGSHRLGRVDIAGLVAESGSERIDGAVPLVCDSGDVIMTNRQLVHGSFANSSPDRRVTVNAGFFARARVLGVTTELLSGEEVTFDEERVRERSRMISVGIDARRQRFPDETSYVYRPGIGQEDRNRWSEEARRTVVRDYNLRDMYI
ncbi:MULTISPECIES: phytanoyl-CoA dioxygenase family protein [unclassified Minwuia]|jgi:Phytanoyl-CoA dioxygenase (PhyH)|uniref:phytanoyl-CoA dioxygenase family protein n=1 Tax=unclassified Minwuia TaxID=2618799 RepID=UPI0024791863|nr:MULTISPECIES: phytanoyl-CoA dioxygenase family protein [unclassified Minwuia]